MLEPTPSIPAVAVPDHELIRPIGRGSYGVVWLARSVLGELRAVKIVRQDGRHDDRPFEREFAGLQKFEPISRSHEGFVHILHAGRFAGGFFYVMELADGAETENETMGKRGNGTVSSSRFPVFPFSLYTPRTLRRELQLRGRLPVAECVEIGLKLTEALAHLHSHGLVHRDIKPSNVIFVRGQPKLADIGLVASADASMSCVGTEGYLPPEGPGKPPADLYALGKLLYELSTGRDRVDFPELPTRLREDSQRQSLEEFNEVILKACDPDLRRRYHAAGQMRADLLLMQSGRSLRGVRAMSRRLALARMVGSVGGAAAALAGGGFWFQRQQTREARKHRLIAEQLAAKAQIQHAEDLLGRGESGEAVALLARILRQDPANRIAAERLHSALAFRNFPRPLAPPLLHPDQLLGAAFSPDGRRIVTRCKDHNLRFWDALTGEETLPPIRHGGWINSVAFSPDGQALVTACKDKTARVLITGTGEARFVPIPHEDVVYEAAFSPQGDVVATASADKQARVHDAFSGRLRFPPLSHEAEVLALAFHPTARWLATVTDSPSVHLWSLTAAKQEHRFRLGGTPSQIRFSGDGKWLAVSFLEDDSGDWEVRLWNLEASPPSAMKLPHKNRLYSLAFSPDSQRLAVATANNVARVWELTSGKTLFELAHSDLVYAAEFSADGRQLLTASVDQTARVWDAATGTPVSEAMCHDNRVIHAEFSHDGSRILTASWDHSVKVWDARPTQPAPPELLHSCPVVSAEFDDTGDHVLTATGRALFTAGRNNRWTSTPPQHAVVWETGTPTRKQPFVLPIESGIITARSTRAGPRVLVAEQDFSRKAALAADHQFSRRAQIWDVSTRERMGAMLHHEHDINCATFSADGLKLAAGSMRGAVRVWDGRQGTPVTPPLSHGGVITSVRFDEAGARLISTSQAGSAIIWDSSTGARLAGPLAHRGEIWFAQFSRDGRKVVTVSVNNSTRIWTDTGQLVRELPHGSPVEYAEFSPDGERLVTASGKRARLWSTETGRQLIDPLSHGKLVLTARFSSDGLRIITASFDQSAQVWDAATGLKLAEAFRHDDTVTSARLSNDGRWAATAAFNGTVKLWTLPSLVLPVADWLPELAEAVAGQRLNDDNVSESVSWTARSMLKSRLAAELGSNPQARWALRILGGLPREPG